MTSTPRSLRYQVIDVSTLDLPCHPPSQTCVLGAQGLLTHIDPAAAKEISAMQRFSKQGGRALWTLLTILSAGVALLIVTIGLKTVEPSDVAAVEEFARGHAAAEAVLAAELKATPKPTHFQLADIRSKVKDTLVAEASHSIVDRVLPADDNAVAAQSVSPEKARELDIERIKRSNWDELNEHERNVYLSHQLLDWAPFVFIPLFVAGLVLVAVRFQRT